VSKRRPRVAPTFAGAGGLVLPQRPSPSRVAVVVLISAYLEGPLVHATIRSAVDAVGPAGVLVFEGPAGEPLPGNVSVPETGYLEWIQLGVRVETGAWSTDAEKRSAMAARASQLWPAPLWALWLDGDELLKNPETLGDWCRYWTWLDELELRAKPEEPPRMGWPIRLVELDGSVALCRGKVVRIDLISSYDVSSSVFTNAYGIQHGEGNVPERLSTDGAGNPGFARKLELALEADRMLIPSWLVAEPFLVHRSLLRHPDRSRLRLHEQEAVEIERAKAEGSFSE
jgi:hypothetical protein